MDDFTRRADTAVHDMNSTDRKLLASILEKIAVRLDMLESEVRVLKKYEMKDDRRR